MEKKLNLIVAAAATNFGIGWKGNIPWRLKKDLSLFARLTKSTSDVGKRNAVIMGRKTWESIPDRNRPLVSRLNIVLSRSPDGLEVPAGTLTFSSLSAAIAALGEPPYIDDVEDIWIIGGASVYKEAMEHPLCNRIYITWVHKNFECDVFMPPIDLKKFQPVGDDRVPDVEDEENGLTFSVQVLQKV